jgi:hypothetical protein
MSRLGLNLFSPVPEHKATYGRWVPWRTMHAIFVYFAATAVLGYPNTLLLCKWLKLVSGWQYSLPFYKNV